MKNISLQDIKLSFNLVRKAYSQLKPEGVNPFSRAEFLETLNEVEKETIENFTNGKLDSVIWEINWNDKLLKDDQILKINKG